MAPPNALYMITSEVSLLLTSMKCSSRSNFWSSQDESKRALLTNLTNLRRQLNEISDLKFFNPLPCLNPFLDVIRSEATTGPITGLALTSVEKFLAYGLLELSTTSSTDSCNNVGIAVETIAEAVIQARFIRSGLSSDEVVLMKIVHLLRTLLLIPSGCLLSNEMVFEILQNCLRICLEAQLSELLRRTTEYFLASIVQLFFSRLPSLIAAADTDSPGAQYGLESLNFTKRSRIASRKPTLVSDSPIPANSLADCVENNDTDKKSADKCQEQLRHDESICSLGDHLVNWNATSQEPEITRGKEEDEGGDSETQLIPVETEVVQEARELFEDSGVDRVSRPYNLRAVHNVFALLVDLLNPEQHQEPVIRVSLSLLTVALETGADFLNACPSILNLITTDMTKYLMMLLYRERVSLFACTLRLCFLLFESLRVHLKLQLEVYFQRLITVISSESERITYEHREIALDAILQLLLLPGLAAEIYVNYDCDPYCSNLFEDILEMLTKNAYPVTRLMGTHLLALDALLAVINAIEVPTDHIDASQSQVSALDAYRGSCPRPNRHWIDSSALPSRSDLVARKTKKKVLLMGSERFNFKPKDGIAFLQKNGVLSHPLNPAEMAAFLAQNPRLDKKTIGEFLSNRKNSEILIAFVRHFNFRGVRIDEALRAYLEAFRIPGEAPLIQHLMESFAAQWFEANEAPFANADAAFTLSYAILMLNTDQHNPNSKRQNIPMTVQDFRKNLKGMNGGGEFDQELVEGIYSSIRTNEIVMPSEQSGSIRENYLWKCLIRRCSQPSFVHFMHLPPGRFDADLFVMIWGSTVAALSFIFDKTTESRIQAKTMAGFVQCARIAAHYRMSDVFDNLTISLCKFTTLLSTSELQAPETLPVVFGRNRKAQLAVRLAFALVATHADILRDGWRSLLDCVDQLFHANLLPSDLVESTDFVSNTGKINLLLGRAQGPAHFREGRGGMTTSRSELGVLGSFYQYLTLGTSPSPLDLEQNRSLSESAASDTKPPMTDTPPTAHPSSPLPSTHSSADLFRLIEEADRSGGGGREPGRASNRPPTVENQQFLQLDEATAITSARATIEACQIGAVVAESKFLMDESLQELIKALLYGLCGGDRFDPPLSSPLLLSANVTLENSSEDVRPASSSSSQHPQFFKTDLATQRTQVFSLELLIRVLLINRDRVDELWPLVQRYLVEILRTSKEPSFLVERIVVGLLRMAFRLLRRQELATQIFSCLREILIKRGQYLLQPPAFQMQQSQTFGSRQIRRAHSPPNASTDPYGQHLCDALSSADTDPSSSIARQVVCGLGVLLQESAADIGSWDLIFSLLEVCGAGAFPISERELNSRDPHLLSHSKRHENMYSSLQDVATEGRKHSRVLGYASDNEEHRAPVSPPAPAGIVDALKEASRQPLHDSALRGESWVLVNVLGEQRNSTTADSPTGLHESGHPPVLPMKAEGDDLVPASRLRLPIVIVFQDWFALEKACDSIVFLVRDPAHITPNNIEVCVHALRVFVEAVLTTPKASLVRCPSATGSRSKLPVFFEAPESRQTDTLTSRFALQLLDLAYTLFSRAPSIYAEWMKPGGEGGSSSSSSDEAAEVPPPPPLDGRPGWVNSTVLWNVCWRALLQAIARLCVDARREVRSDALAFLQRALLSPILHTLNGEQWEDCLMQVLFPLLTNFLESVTFDDPSPSTPADGGRAREQTRGGGGGGGFPTTSGGGSFFGNIFGVGAVDPSRSTNSGGGGGGGGGGAVGIAEYTDPRMRAIPLLTKIFLQHLNPLYALESFPLLWRRVLVYMARYIKANISDSLNDAVRESLKNLLLVLYTGTQDTPPILVRDAPEGSKEALLWAQTQTHLTSFMPNLINQLFPPPQPPTATQAVLPSPSASNPSPPPPSTLHQHEQQQLPQTPHQTDRDSVPHEGSNQVHIPLENTTTAEEDSVVKVLPNQ